MCWLLRLRSADQLRTHPLRGAIFETWVASEVLKHRANAGERDGVYFYRDQHGVEADLLIEHGDQMTVLEVKAGQTATTDLLAPAKRVAEALAAVKKTRVMAIYGGDTSRTRSDIQLVPWSQLDVSLVSSKP